MKRSFIYIFLMCFLLQAPLFAQTIRVLDETTLTAIPNAEITSELNKDNPIYTDVLGQADISKIAGADRITIEAVGYKTRQTSFDKLKSTSYRVYMSETVYSVDEIVVSELKFPEKLSDVPKQVDIITAPEIRFKNQQTTADLLQNTGNVLVQKSQLGGGSPILRGLEANKILLVIDGIRLNNAIFRGGHLQNVLRIDQDILSRAEVLFGNGSVIYGSDALGGVISFTTKDPLLSPSKKTLFTTSAYGRYSSVDEEKAGHLDFNIGLEKVAFLTSLTYNDIGDLKQGSSDGGLDTLWSRNFVQGRINGMDTMLVNDDNNLQTPSGYYQYDILQKVLFKQNNNVSHMLNFHYSNTNDIPRYDRLAAINSNGQFNSAEWYYGPEKRILGSYQMRFNTKKTIFDNGLFTLAYQDIEESRHSRSWNSSNRTDRNEKVKVYSGNLDFAKKINNSDLSYGLEFYYNDVNSTASRENINTGAITPASTRYADGGATMSTFAAYFSNYYEFNRNFVLTQGIRYNYVDLEATFNDTTFYKYPAGTVSQINNALTGNLGMVIYPDKKKNYKISLMGSTGFRAPNVDDLSKVFDSQPGSVIVPNPNLGPENSYQGELTFAGIFGDRVLASVTGYYNYLQNIIITAPFLVNGQDSIVYDGVLSQVLANQNAQTGYIYGFNFSLNADISDNFAFNGTVNYTYGRIKTDTTDYPLDHIPPLFGRAGLIFKYDKLKSEFYTLFNGMKDKDDYNLFGEDNFSGATPEGMPGWFTLNFDAIYQFVPYAAIQVGVENILDKRYRVFASGISAPGRNFVATLRLSY